MGNSCDLSSQEVSFLALEGRVRVNAGIEVPGQDVLDLSSSLDVGGSGVRKLDPVLKEVFVDPVDVFVNTLTATLVRPVAALLLSLVEDSFDDPVILLDTVELSPESKSSGTAESGQSLLSK